MSDAGGIGLYSALNSDNATESNGGSDETIQIRSNQGTGVATADIANLANAQPLISDAGGIALASGLNGDNAVRIEVSDGGIMKKFKLIQIKEQLMILQLKI